MERIEKAPDVLSAVMAGDPDAKSNGFPKYLEQATALGVDVNDWLEDRLNWTRAKPLLDELVIPRLRQDAEVCELGPGTGRWARHLARHCSQGTLHLVDHSDWICRFLRLYFLDYKNVRVHLNDGRSLPFCDDASLDLIFSAGTFTDFNVDLVHCYAREFFRILKVHAFLVFNYSRCTSAVVHAIFSLPAFEWTEVRELEHGHTFTVLKKMRTRR